MPFKDLLFYIDFKTPDAVADTVAVVKRFGIEERVIMGAIPTAANLEVSPRKNRHRARYDTSGNATGGDLACGPKLLLHRLRFKLAINSDPKIKDSYPVCTNSSVGISDCKQNRHGVQPGSK